MTLRDLSDRARTEGMRAIRGLLEGGRGRRADRDSIDAVDVDDAIELHADDADVAGSLDRIAETIDRLAAQLDVADNERAEQLDAIEFLLREMMLGGTVGTRSLVLGGAVDADARDEPAVDITLVAEGFPLEVDTPVEVRSRFHDRWICGFAIAEAVAGGSGPCRYRLTRRSDGIPLPILFDARDVRAAAPRSPRQPAAD
jgi:hypothetical protein